MQTPNNSKIFFNKFFNFMPLKHIENTRLVLNIAQVYPARLRKSKIMRLAE